MNGRATFLDQFLFVLGLAVAVTIVVDTFEPGRARRASAADTPLTRGRPWPFPRIFRHGDRYQLWPIRIARPPATMRGVWVWHGWQTWFERCPESRSGRSCMPGWRGVFGQTLTLGIVQVKLGRKDEARMRASIDEARALARSAS